MLFVDPNFFSLIEHGGLVGALCLAVWFLNRRNDVLTAKVENRYDAELTDVRRRQEECERDREQLHRQIAAILQDDE